MFFENMYSDSLMLGLNDESSVVTKMMPSFAWLFCSSFLAATSVKFYAQFEIGSHSDLSSFSNSINLACAIISIIAIVFTTSNIIQICFRLQTASYAYTLQKHFQTAILTLLTLLSITETLLYFNLSYFHHKLILSHIIRSFVIIAILIPFTVLSYFFKL